MPWMGRLPRLCRATPWRAGACRNQQQEQVRLPVFPALICPLNAGGAVEMRSASAAEGCFAAGTAGAAEAEREASPPAEAVGAGRCGLALPELLLHTHITCLPAQHAIRALACLGADPRPPAAAAAMPTQPGTSAPMNDAPCLL